MGYAWKISVRLPGTGYWVLAFSGIGASEVLYAAYLTTWMLPLAAIAYIAELCGIILLIRGCAAFAMIDRPMTVDALIGVFGVLGSMLFSVHFPEPSLRAFFGNLALSALCLRASAAFFTARNPAVRRELFYVSLLLGILGFFEFAQGTIVFVSGNPNAYVELKNLFLVLYSFLYTALAVTLLQLGYTRFQRDLNEKTKEKELLLREMHHRTKNNLSLVCSLVTLESAESQDDAAREAFGRIESRIRTVARLHEQLQHSSATRIVDAEEYLSDVLDLLHAPFKGTAERVFMEKEVAAVHIDIGTAIPLGLIVNELATNALKHAFPGDRRGKIRICLGCASELLELTVSDDGVGIAANARDDSLGMTLVKALSDQLKGNLSVESGNGTRIVLSFPAASFSCAQNK